MRTTAPTPENPKARAGPASTPAVRLRWGVGLGLLAALGLAPAASAAGPTPAAAGGPRAPADGLSEDAGKLAAWVISAGDHQGTPFLIVDKVGARVFAFDREGRLLGAAPALLGLGRGDESPPDIGRRKLADIPPAERVTPAGRFVAALGENLGGKDILWIDYDAAVSLHRVDTATPRERRLQRLATPSAADNRISYGCINVPAEFYETIIHPLFRATTGVVYILPEVRPVEDVFFARPSE